MKCKLLRRGMKFSFASPRVSNPEFSPTMDVDANTSPLDVIENTDISALVEILYEYTPRDLKALISSEGARLFRNSILLWSHCPYRS